MRLDIFFRPTSLPQTLMMLVLLVGGLGLIVCSFRSTAEAGTDEPG